jgi:hypothetical protein
MAEPGSEARAEARAARACHRQRRRICDARGRACASNGLPQRPPSFRKSSLAAPGCSVVRLSARGVTVEPSGRAIKDAPAADTGAPLLVEPLRHGVGAIGLARTTTRPFAALVTLT